MRPALQVIALGVGAAVIAAAADRINQEGRLLGPPPVVTAAILFNTPAADAVLSAMQVFPVTHPWNEDVSRRPLLPNSDAMIAQISADLSASRRTLRVFFEMNFVLVPDDQPPVPIELFNYPDESDPGPYPIPTDLPVETWPRETGVLTLAEWQRDVNNDGGDRHAIIVQPGRGWVWETWLTKLNANNRWEASNGAKFDLNSNATRPAGWTSADAAGLTMFPALVRYDECQRGMVEHALRLVVKRTRRDFIFPATHFASSTAATLTNVPAMGQRLRLRAGFVIPDDWSKAEQAVLRALRKYGAIVADNGNFFSISATPDDRWPPGEFAHLASLSLTNFQVVQATGPNDGPRSPGAPTAHAGPDQTASPGVPIPLQGSVSVSGTAPLIRWSVGSGPGEVVFADAARTNTTATCAAPGSYTLVLSADDGVHAVAYAAVHLRVEAALRVGIQRSGTSALLSWNGGIPPFVLERVPSLPAAWTPFLTTSVQEVSLPVAGVAQFFRVQQP